MKLSKQEQKYRAKQQLANKFLQKDPPCWGSWGTVKADKNAVRKLVDRVCK